MKDLETHKAIYKSTFESEHGKYILEDLKNLFCVNSDILTDSDAYKEGLRIAFRYIESNLINKK